MSFAEWIGLLYCQQLDRVNCAGEPQNKPLLEVLCPRLKQLLKELMSLCTAEEVAL
jgi:hypothetical protein